MEKSHQASGSRIRKCLAGSSLSQSSLEYLLVVALTFAIIVPTTYLFYNYSKDSSHEITDALIAKIGRGIVDASESIFYSGLGSKTVLELNIPENVGSAHIIDNRELVFNMTASFGVSEAVFFSSVYITTDNSDCSANFCRLPGLSSSGLKKVKIEAISKDAVSITTI